MPSNCLDCFERFLQDRIDVLGPIRKEYPMSDGAKEWRDLQHMVERIRQYRNPRSASQPIPE